MQLSQKETMLLSDMKSQEKLCIEKYSKNAQAANDVQLKNLFSELGEVERKHLTMLSDIGNGKVPTVSSGTGMARTFSATYSAESHEKTQDCFLCNDLLAIEKHASSVYDTCIFEFTDAGVRNVLNHIQKEEQNHGKAIYDYMKANGMYS